MRNQKWFFYGKNYGSCILMSVFLWQESIKNTFRAIPETESHILSVLLILIFSPASQSHYFGNHLHLPLQDMEAKEWPWAPSYCTGRCWSYHFWGRFSLGWPGAMAIFIPDEFHRTVLLSGDWLGLHLQRKPAERSSTNEGSSGGQCNQMPFTTVWRRD